MDVTPGSCRRRPDINMSHQSSLSPTYNWTNVKRRLSIIYRKKYDKLSDVSYINEFTKNGLNIDLNQGMFDEPDKDFFRRWKVSAFVNGVSLLIAILSSIFWDSKQVDPLYIGAYLKGMGLPKEIMVIAFLSSVLSASANLFFSYKIFKKDPYLFYLMNLLRVVTGSTNDHVRGVSPEVIRKLRSEIKPLIALFRILVREFHAGHFSGFVLAFGSYAMISLDNVTNPQRLLLTLVWSIHLILFVDQLLWSVFACGLVIVILSRFFVLTIEMLDEEESALTIEAPSEDLFFHQLNQMMYILHFIRRYNSPMKSVIGFTTTFLAIGVTLCVFTTVFVNDLSLPMHLFYVFVVCLPVYLTILIMALCFIAKFSSTFVMKAKRLCRMTDHIYIAPKIRQRLNYIMDEMRYETSFDWFGLIHEIDYAFVLRVLAEMLCFFMLAVDVYVVG